MMERMIKAFYILMIAMVVFLGGLLISQGIHESHADAQEAIAPSVIIDQEGNAL
ncbi:MAG: hypothetical protein IKU34_02705 [Clostridia bacterium]|nr:hypothetical protein [Clostridia bacterium]